ncbi:MAG TPA: ABC transporter permease [Spirochaetia bacterium]|nr:ABC transporter permease [Spirochaetia bacterium]
MHRIFYIVQKEFRQIRRTKAYFGLIFVAPFVMLLVMGSAITTEVKHVPVVVLDRDHSPKSREIVNACAASSSFSFLGMVDSQAAAKELLDDGKVKLVIDVPAHFARDVATGAAPSVQVLVDGVDGNSAGVGLGYVTAMLAQVQARWAAERPSRMPAGPAQISVVPRMWYNPNLESKLNFVPGLIGVLLVMMTTFLTAVNIVREKEVGTLEQLMVTPLASLELMIGKIIPFAILGFAQLTMSVIAAGVVFGIWMKGGLLTFYAMAAVFALSTLGLGIFVSTLARTQQQAMFIAWFIMIFALLLSGFFVPIENMPPFIQYITYVNPLRYFITVLREIYVKGTEFRFMWREALAMGAIGVAAIVSASVRFQKRVK